MTSARKPRIYVTQLVAKSAVARLRDVATVTVNPDASRIIGRRALVAAVRRCDILFCLLHDQIDAGIISANPALRLVAAQSITPSNIDVEAASARGIPVTVVPARTTEATADLAFALLLAAARRVVEGDRMVRARKFPGAQSGYLLGSFVWNKTIGLVGGGGLIGRAVARRAHGLQGLVPLPGEPRVVCFLVGSGWIARAHSLWRNAALARCCLSTLRFSAFATCSGPPSHCRPSAQDEV